MLPTSEVMVCFFLCTWNKWPFHSRSRTSQAKLRFPPGNCLFNALSDQLYGHQNEHANIRLRVISHMRQHASYYKQFIDVNPGGGIRRNPKRKNVSAASSSSFVAPSQSDIDRVFDSHLQSMARGGTYGDNMEITAFASEFKYDVKIYQRDFAYVVSSGQDGDRPVAHIAYHIWEHYSSIRNLDGPHSGLPEVAPKALSLQEEQMQMDKLAQTPHVLPWQIDVVSASLPYLADKPTIKRALEATKGNIDAAVSSLLDAENDGSASSHQGSSSVERDHDESDENSHNGPNKKQDRRLSRASRTQKNRSHDTTHALSKLATLDGSQETFASWESESSLSSAADLSQNSNAPNSTQTSFDDSCIVVKQEASKASSDAPAKPIPRLKLLPPRPPDASQQRNNKSQQRQNGPRITARDRKDIKKQAQKAARKERQQAAGQSGLENPTQVKLSLRAKGVTERPPVDTLRTLYI